MNVPVCWGYDERWWTRSLLEILNTESALHHAFVVAVGLDLEGYADQSTVRIFKYRN
jgi:hypothetical protein